jgi:hypothetical protein
MISAEERMRILQMLQEGMLTPQAAAELLQAMEGPADRTTPAAAPVQQPMWDNPEPTRQPRWLRVRVTDSDTGRPRVNVRLPLSLVSMGVKLGSHFAPEIEGLDVEALIEAARTGGVGQFVDVYDEEDGEHVEVFLE